MAIKGVFFDVYGTLVASNDSEAAWAAWASAFFDTFQHFGCGISRDIFCEKCSHLFDVPAPTAARKNLSRYENRIVDFANALDFPASTECVHATASATVRSWKHFDRLDPEAIPLLQALRNGRKLAAISNFDHPTELRETLLTHKLADFFDIVVISGEAGVEKPDPAIFRIALDQLDLKPEEVVHIGDSPEDVEGAVAAGCHAIRIIREGDIRSCVASPKHMVTRLSDCPSVLSALEALT
jgi:HAD superfamily hydrolase (TIGR01549 family)